MLDDLKYIHERDAQDALGIAEKQWQQLEYNFDVTAIEKLEVSNIVYAGMGGSALAALLSNTWPGYSVPFEVCRHYDLPAYVNAKTLLIAASYSGNTEETLSAIAQAESKKAKVVVIAGGGKLQDIAEEKGYPLLALPKAEQPRYAVLYNLKALIQILEAAQLVKSNQVTRELTNTANFLKDAIGAWVPTIPTDDNPAKQLALEIMGKSPAIYAGPLLAPAAYKWKISFNENAKSVAWWGVVPEFDHNELTGWSSHPTDKPYAVVDLRSSLEHPRVLKRFEVADRLLSGKRPAAHIVDAAGKTLVEQLLWSVAFGDFVTLYLAMLNGVNPTPVELVEKFKKELG